MFFLKPVANFEYQDVRLGGVRASFLTTLLPDLTPAES